LAHQQGFNAILEKYQPKNNSIPTFVLCMGFTLVTLLTLGFFCTASAEDAYNSSSAEERWSSFLPIWGGKARERGHDLPLPFGVTANFMFIKQDYDVERIELDIGGIDLELADSVVGGYVSGEDFSMVLRFGAWIFPFLNVYALAGYTDGETSTHVKIPLGSGRGERAISFPFTLEYKGPTLGGGLTLAGGMRNIFAVFDANYTETDLDIADSEITALVLSPRIGYQCMIGSWKGKFWVGGMYQDVEQTIRGRVQFGRILEPVHFDVKQKAAKPWNMTLGMLFNVTPNINVTVEAGFIGRDQILTAFGYRF
jgi:hypothetical protein